MMVPMVRCLQKTYPHLSITWIIARPFDQLLQGLSGVDFLVIDKPRTLRDFWRLYRHLSHFHFDVLIAAQANLRANLTTACVKAKHKIGFGGYRSREGHRFFVDRQVEFRPNHILESFLQFAEALDAPTCEVQWGLPIGEKDRAYAEKILGQERWIAINPMASKPDRNWPVDRQVALINTLWAQWKLPVVLTGGPLQAERDQAQQITRELQGRYINLVGETSLKQLAAILERTAVLVSPDTGPAHVASAMGTPVIGLYAVITSQLSAPYTSRQWVIDKYPEALRQLKGKNPDEVSWGTRVHDEGAMGLITVDEVLQRLQQVLDL